MKIVIGGYYGFGNLGDELILSTLMNELNRRYQAPEIVVLSSKPYKTSREHRIPAIDRWDVLKVLQAIRSAQLFVLGGGGLFQDRTSARSMVYYLGLVAMARFFSVKTVLYSMGVDPLSRPWLRILTRWIIRSPQVNISVRDRESKHVLQEMGFKDFDIALVADPVFLYPVKPAARQFDVFLIPRFPAGLQGSHLYHLIVSQLTRRTDLSWRFTLFQPEMEHKIISHENNAFSKVMGHYVFREDYHSQAASVGLARTVLSARFHGLVLASSHGIPFVGLGDERKVVHLCKRLGMPHLNWDARPEEIDRVLERLLGRKELVK